MASRRRPEHQAPPQIFYGDEEARKYTTSSRMIEIQRDMSDRAIELLALPDDTPCLVLDVGCGSGLSGDSLTDFGHEWIGVDISQSMLSVAQGREVDGDVILGDAGQGVSFRPGMFDGVISISAVQWLCNADHKSHQPHKRLYRFFSTLYGCMQHGSRAVLQVYPESPLQLELITSCAMKAGFGGGVVIDYPNSSKAKKIFLCLFCGLVPKSLPQGLDKNDLLQSNVPYSKRATSRSSTNRLRKPLKGSREWIEAKKERRRRQGRSVRQSSKYTGRKRKTKF